MADKNETEVPNDNLKEVNQNEEQNNDKKPEEILSDDFPFPEGEEDKEDEGGNGVGILNLLNIIKNFTLRDTEIKTPTKESVIELTLEGVAKLIKEGKANNIIVMSGAGISVAAGIPDFRSPKTGLYHQLKKYDLPTPESVFEIKFVILF